MNSAPKPVVKLASLFTARRLIAGFLALVGSLGSLGQALAQLTTMRTGSGDVLASQTIPYKSNASSQLSIDFGFATEEQVTPNMIYDSFTVSISGPGGVAYLVTADASGPQWRPFVPGAITVPDLGFDWKPTSFLVSPEGGQPIGSYELNFAVPSNWMGVPLTIEFDLFDNQNGESSLGYYAVAVPEPANTILLLLSAAVCCLWSRKR
jgi:hypothetical protein